MLSCWTARSVVRSCDNKPFACCLSPAALLFHPSCHQLLQRIVGPLRACCAAAGATQLGFAPCTATRCVCLCV